MNGEKVLSKIKHELTSYETDTFEISDGYYFSAYKLIKRIMMFKNQQYPTGKLDSQGNYKYWYDIISPRCDAEIKNIDFDTKDILLASDAENDAGRLIIANARLGQFLKQTGQAAKLNEAVERGTEWGNLVAKKLKDDYKLLDLNNVMVLNQTAETLEDSDVIEKEIMVSSDLRKKMEIWDNVKELIDEGKSDEKKTSPDFFIYERNGEITEQEYNDAKGKSGGDKNKYILCKVIVGGNKKNDPKHILWCDEVKKKPYFEYHRGKYSGRWMRVGMFEVLFDAETRANEIGNQIARGLEWSSKTIFASEDKVLAQNILTDLQNGDVIKGKITQVSVRMEGLDQLIADWNRIMEIADKLANSYEVVSGANLPSGTPFALANLQNANANKLFDFIREKLTITFTDIISEWVLPDILKDLKSLDILKLTDDAGFLQRYAEMVIDEWYINNLVSFPPHNQEIAQVIKAEKVQELIKDKELMVKLSREMWDGFKPRVKVVITGENYQLASDLETLKAFITLEQDSVRRTALIEKAMAKKNIDVSKLPKSPPQPLPQPTQAQPQVSNKQVV